MRLRPYPAVDYHDTDEIPDVDYIPHLCCPDCVSDTPLADRSIPDNQYYYCAPCKVEWCIPGPMPRGEHPDAGDIARAVTFLLAAVALFLGNALFWTERLLPSFQDTDDGHAAAALVGTMIGVLPAVTMLALFIALVNTVIAPASVWAWRFVWGEPL